MGVYYFYANDSKQEWFSIDPAGIDIKAAGIGAGVGARALGLLLLEDHPAHSLWDDHPLLGRWAGDSVRVSGDDYDPAFPGIEERWSDISADVIDFLSVVAPESFLDPGRAGWFRRFAEHAMTEPVRQRLLRHVRRSRHDAADDRFDEAIRLLRPRAGDD